MFRRPRRSPLFPSRRLSRSRRAVPVREPVQGGAEPHPQETPVEDVRLDLLDPELHEELPESLDRKSTRLNSSHQIISYAVFCLKKKTLTPFSTSPITTHC